MASSPPVSPIDPASGAAPSIRTPSLLRRLTAMLYEAFLLTAVEMLVTFVYLVATRNQHSPAYDHTQHCIQFLVTAAYFIHAWIDSGHTLAMKTWRIKLVLPGHARVPPRIAAKRFLLAWGWFLPALAACYLLNVRSWSGVAIALAIGIAAWATTALFDRNGQFLHDRLTGTRLIQLPSRSLKAAKPVKPADPAV
jgi:uncharacterized RDD family membrane protein YckC